MNNVSNLAFFKPDDLGPGRESAPLPERVLAGDPRLTNWDVEQSLDGKVSTGVWEITPETTRKIWLIYGSA